VQPVPNIICEFDNFDACGYVTALDKQNEVVWVVLSRDVTSNYTSEYTVPISVR
jgi:hypothetical protein